MRSSLNEMVRAASMTLVLLLLAGCQPNPGPMGALSEGTAPADDQANSDTADTDNSDTNRSDNDASKGSKGARTSEITDEAEDEDTSDETVTTENDAQVAAGVIQGEQQDDPNHPFPRRLAMPEFQRELEWLNTKPLKLADMRGKFVILDFWTYCCINCMHILPELKKLEEAYPEQLVVIGVHSAKFTTEEETDNIAEAIMRYEIRHPVVNDNQHLYWDRLQIQSWPTVVLIDPEGKAIAYWEGEVTVGHIEPLLKRGIPYYRQKKLLDETPLRFELLEYKSPSTPLRYPGKIVADEASGRLFIADSNHNRIVIATLDGNLLDVIGSGKLGRADGSFTESSFNHPQGMALDGDTLYIADTENHLLRKVDLQSKTVATIAGIGEQGRNPWPGGDPLSFELPAPPWLGKPKETGLNSPWDLWVHDQALYIAMAGSHQIWKMPLDESEIGPYAGNGREDIVDGRLLPTRPYAENASSFAQPSGLTADENWLYVADSEGSSIRAVPFDKQQKVRTVIGTANLPIQRLFTFGDEDGDRTRAKLQHCLAVTYHDGKLYVADTYNNKIKLVNARTGKTQTLVGTREPGTADNPPQFHEPGGITYAAGKLYVADTNNHLIRSVDLKTQRVATLEINGLKPPARGDEAAKPSFANAKQIELTTRQVQVQDGKLRIHVSLILPEGWKMNELAPLRYWVEPAAESGPVDRTSVVSGSIDQPKDEFDLEVPVTGEGEDSLELSLIYYYCQKSGSLCKEGSAVVKMPVEIGPAGETELPAVIKVEDGF